MAKINRYVIDNFKRYFHILAKRKGTQIEKSVIPCI